MSAPWDPTETVAHACMKRMIVEFVQHFDTWPTLVLKGYDTCLAIERQLKCQLLSPPLDGDSCKHYTGPLSASCKKLDQIMDTLNMKVFVAEQLIAAFRNQATWHTGVIGKTWTLKRALDAMEEIIESLKKEMELRQKITENIGHAMTYPEMAWNVSTWKNLIDGSHSQRDLTMKMLSHEFGCT